MWSRHAQLDEDPIRSQYEYEMAIKLSSRITDEELELELQHELHCKEVVENKLRYDLKSLSIRLYYASARRCCNEHCSGRPSHGKYMDKEASAQEV